MNNITFNLDASIHQHPEYGVMTISGAIANCLVSLKSGDFAKIESACDFLKTKTTNGAIKSIAYKIKKDLSLDIKIMQKKGTVYFYKK